jgi:transposase
MSSRKSKRHALQELRAWNAHPEKIKAKLFASDPFFDPEDKAQVKYEMLRCREIEMSPLAVACREFGFTRESYRHILERFRSEGMGGLFGQKRGRRRPLKANNDVRILLHAAHTQDPSWGPDQLARHCQEKIGVTLSRRTVYRILADEGERKKKRRSKKPLQKPGRGVFMLGRRTSGDL